MRRRRPWSFEISFANFVIVLLVLIAAGSSVVGPAKAGPYVLRAQSALPRVVVLATGGTIASRFDPAIGALAPIERGAWFDIFIAVGLRDAALVERCLRDDPEALDHRIWRPWPHRGRMRCGRRPIDRRLGYDDIVELLMRHASPTQRLLAAYAGADREAAEVIVASHPNVMASLTRDQMRLMVDRAHANDTAAVALMLRLGFDPLARGVDDWEPIRWAAFHGNVEMLELLLPHNPPIGVPDPTYGGTPLGQCLYGSLHGWERETGDFATTVRVLLDAGERPDLTVVPIGRDDVDAVLREHFVRLRRT